MPPLTIPEGGTNATTAFGALVELGVPMGTVETVVAGTAIVVTGDPQTVQVAVGTVPVLNGGTGATSLAAARTALAGGAIAPTNNPTLTGTPRAPNPATNSNDTQIATTSWVTGKLGDASVTAISGGTF